jgi:hypothetical protein
MQLSRQLSTSEAGTSGRSQPSDGSSRSRTLLTIPYRHLSIGAGRLVCSSSSPQSRFRLADVTSNKNDTPWASPSGDKEEAGDQQPLLDGVSVRNAHAQRARLFPLGADLYKLELHREYSSDWPSLQFQDNTIVLKRGFLEPLEDPDAPNFFLYR